MFKKILLTASLLMFFVASTAYAHEEETAVDPGLLPGNPLYFLEIISEGFGSFFTFGSVAKAERSLGLAEERLNEAHALADNGKYQRAERQVKKYENQFMNALEKAGDVKEEALAEGADEIVAELEGLLLEISDATVKHQAVLVSIFQEVSEGVQQGIADAIDVSAVGNNADLDIEVEQLPDFGGAGVDFGEIGALLDGLFGEEFDFEDDLFDEDDIDDDAKDEDHKDDAKEDELEDELEGGLSDLNDELGDVLDGLDGELEGLGDLNI